MRTWELQQLKQAKNKYFTRCGLHDDGSRRRELSLLRGAFANAFRSKASLLEMGKILEIDHSSVVYAHNEHSARLSYTDYRSFYKIACELRSEVDLEVVEDFNVGSLEKEITRLNDLVTELSKYKELYLTLKKTFDEF